MTNFETPRVAKLHAWNAGAEAFADFVQKAFAEAMKAAEENHVADVPPLTWEEVAQRFARFGTHILTEGLPVVMTHNPFVLREFTQEDAARLNRALAGGPQRKKKNASASPEHASHGTTQND